MSEIPTGIHCNKMTGKDQRVTIGGEDVDQLILLIQEAKRQITIEKKPIIAMEALNAATDILGNPHA